MVEVYKKSFICTLLTTNFPNTITLYKLFTSLAFYTPWSAVAIHHDRDAYVTVLIQRKSWNTLLVNWVISPKGPPTTFVHVGRRNKKTGRSFISLEGSLLRPRKQDDACKKECHIHVSLFQFPCYIDTCHIILNKIELNDSRTIKSCFAKFCRLQGDEGIIVHQVWFPKGLFPLISRHMTSFLVKVWIKHYFDLGFILSSFHRFVLGYQCNTIRFGALGIEPKRYNLSANSYFPWRMFLVNFSLFSVGFLREWEAIPKWCRDDVHTRY